MGLTIIVDISCSKGLVNIKARYIDRLLNHRSQGIPTTLSDDNGIMFKEDPGSTILALALHCGQRLWHTEISYDIQIRYVYSFHKILPHHPWILFFHVTTSWQHLSLRWISELNDCFWYSEALIWLKSICRSSEFKQILDLTSDQIKIRLSLWQFLLSSSISASW